MDNANAASPGKMSTKHSAEKSLQLQQGRIIRMQSNLII